MKPSELHLRGNVRSDSDTLTRFSRDASAYKIKPRLVVEPENR